MNTQPPFPQKPNTPPPYSSIRLLLKLDHTSRLIANVYPTIPAKKKEPKLMQGRMHDFNRGQLINQVWAHRI